VLPLQALAFRWCVQPALPGAQPLPDTAGVTPTEPIDARPQQPIAYGTNGFAVASLILGIVWVFWIGSLLAIIFGHVARSQNKQRGVRSGNGMAVAGLILGYGSFALFALLIAAGGTFHFEVHA